MKRMPWPSPPSPAPGSRPCATGFGLASAIRARSHFDAGVAALRDHRAGELLAEELRLAHQALGEITGEFTSDDLLGRIFSTFCIGK